MEFWGRRWSYQAVCRFEHSQQIRVSYLSRSHQHCFGTR